jgi:fucose permease
MLREAVLRRPAARITWLCALFLLGYVGIEVALGGWITTFMLKVRSADSFSSGMAAMGFWLGLTVGRFTLGFLTRWLGVRLAVSVSSPTCSPYHFPIALLLSSPIIGVL